MIDMKVLVVGKTPDFILLVSRMLFARANSQITYYHILKYYTGATLPPLLLHNKQAMLQ